LAEALTVNKGLLLQLPITGVNLRNVAKLIVALRCFTTLLHEVCDENKRLLNS